MDYSQKYFELKHLYKLKDKNIQIDNFIDVKTFPFSSESKWDPYFSFEEKRNEELLTLGMPDSHFQGNNQFTYPVFIPNKKKIYDKVIVLLHGLNERFWDKYLPWAYYLALYTNRPVILFPLSFHMNRAPEDWADPKKMSPFVTLRKNQLPTEELTFANLALSCRLTNEPLRFMRSGYQSTEDLVKLTKLIGQGSIPFLQKGTTTDFFAYSIGAFVSQILLLANPDQLFTNSKFFLFCGGAFFKDMCGVSKLIMDKAAYTRINTFYTNTFDKIIQDKQPIAEFLHNNILGRAFYAMLKEENHKSFRESRFEEMSNNLYSLSLAKDRVIPYSGTIKAMCFNKQREAMSEVMDLPYIYTHENPFPISGKIDKNIVDFWFEKIFKKAAHFFNMTSLEDDSSKNEERVHDEIYL